MSAVACPADGYVPAMAATDERGRTLFWVCGGCDEYVVVGFEARPGWGPPGAPVLADGTVMVDDPRGQPRYRLWHRACTSVGVQDGLAESR